MRKLIVRDSIDDRSQTIDHQQSCMNVKRWLVYVDIGVCAAELLSCLEYLTYRVDRDYGTGDNQDRVRDSLSII